MRPCLQNEIKLWWHNLTRMHRRGSYADNGIMKSIFCYDCKYGEDSKSLEGRRMFREELQ